MSLKQKGGKLQCWTRRNKQQQNYVVCTGTKTKKKTKKKTTKTKERRSIRKATSTKPQHSARMENNAKERKIRIVTTKSTIIGDLIKNNIVIYNKNKKITKNFKISKNSTYTSVHKSIIKNDNKQVCNLKQGLKIMKIISKIKKNDK